MKQAYQELQRVKNLSAFNVLGYSKKRRVNQYLTRYYFPDSSVLSIFPVKSMASAYGGEYILTEYIRINVST